MKYRCTNPNSHKYPRYGGRGITVCDEWLESFQAFYDHIGDAPTPKHSLDRIDNDGNYEPGNVRWATPHQQRVNQENGTRELKFNGEVYTLTGAAKKFGMAKWTLFRRLDRGWGVERALTTPVRKLRKSQ